MMKTPIVCFTALALLGCGGGSFSAGAELGDAGPDPIQAPDASGSGGSTGMATGGQSTVSHGGQGSGGAGGAAHPSSGGSPTGDAGDGGLSAGGTGSGGQSGTGGSCQAQTCANDGLTCGDVPDGCGSTSKCLHQCGTGETCDTTHHCACHAADVCPATLKDGSLFWNACCTTTGACGEDYYGCNPVGACTYTGSMGTSSGCAAGEARWQCPGLTIGPAAACTQVAAIPAQGALAYFCCPKASYP